MGLVTTRPCKLAPPGGREGGGFNEEKGQKIIATEEEIIKS